MGINKIDYYVGALLSHLVKKQIAPAIIDTSDNSKQLIFDTDNGKYNLFVKYSSKPVRSNDKTDKWVINFTTAEYNVVNALPKEGYKNFVVLICSKETLNNTEVAVLSLEKALKIMGNDNINKVKRIDVKAQKGSKYLKVFGTTCLEENATKVERNLAHHFK